MSDGDDQFLDKLIWGQAGEFSVINVVMAMFFLAWNSMCARIPLVPLVRLIVLGVTAARHSFDPILLIFPHWYIGIGIPCWIGGLVSGIPAVLIPYTFVTYTCVKLACEEKGRTSANEATRLKYEVFSILKKTRNQVEDADHPEDVQTALLSLLEELSKVKLDDKTPLLDGLPCIENGLVIKSDVKPTDDAEDADPADPAETNEVMESNENNELQREKSSASSFSALVRIASGKKHFQSGVRKDERIPIVQAKVVSR